MFHLETLGLDCSATKLAKMTKRHPAIRGTLEGRERVYERPAFKALEKLLYAEKAEKEMAKAAPPSLEFPERYRDHVRDFAPMYVALTYDTSTRTYAPYIGPKKAYCSSNRKRASSWSKEELDAAGAELVMYTRALEFHLRLGLRKRIPWSPVRRHELPPIVAHYPIQEGIPEPVGVRPQLLGFPPSDRYVPDAIPINHARRIPISRILRDHTRTNGGAYVLLVWTRGVRLEPGTLKPMPRSRIERSVVAEMKKTGRLRVA